MNRQTQMLYNRSRRNREDYRDEMRNNRRMEYRNTYDEDMSDKYYPSDYNDRYYNEDYEMRFRDRRGREHYDNGRYAPQNRMGNVTDLRGSYNQIGFATSNEYEDELTDEEAEEWVDSLKNGSGANGEHWSLEQTEKVMKQRAINCDPVEFWVVMNVLYSDYFDVFKKYNMGGNVNFYADMAKAWLDDKDAIDNKLAMYYRYMVKK